MKLLITIYQDEDGVFIAECPSIPGCVSQGKSEVEAEINIRMPSRNVWKCALRKACP